MIVSITDYYFLGTETSIYSKWAWLSLDLIPAPGFDSRIYMASLGYIKSQAYTVRLYLKKKKNEQKLVLFNFTVNSEKFGICFMDSSELCLFKDWSFCLR